METKPNQMNTSSKTSGTYDAIPGSTPREKLQNMYARLRATASAGPGGVISDSVTPSSGGDIDPVLPVSATQTTLPLSTRVPEELADFGVPVDDDGDAADLVVVSPALLFPEEARAQTIQPSAIFEKSEDVVPGSIRLGPSEFVITMPMDSIGRDNCERTLAEYSEYVKLLLSGFKLADGSIASDTQRSQTLSCIRELIEKLDNIAVHADLNIAEHVKQSQLDPQKEASWAEYRSSKFVFLGHFIEIAGAQNLHLIFIVGNDEGVELVERYFIGKGFAHVRPRVEMRGIVELSLNNGSLSVGIISSQHDGIVETYRPPSVIFAMDSSFDATTPCIEHMRTAYARHGNLLPVVHLLISNSSEHIQRCLPDFPEVQRLRLLVHIVKSLLDVIGDLQDDALSVQDDAEEIFTYLMSDDFNASWNLPSIEPLHILVSDDTQDEDSPDSHIVDSMAAPSINKRIFKDAIDIDTPDSKRQRLQQSQDLTQTTESSSRHSQTLELTVKLQAVENRLVEMEAEHAVEVNRLQNTISELEPRLAERIQGWEDIQHRYESRNKEFHQLRKERDNLIADKAKIEQRTVRHQEEITKLKDERTELKHELESARNAIKAEGGLKEELEKAREEIRQLSSNSASLERKAEYERKQAEYAREQYQNASNSAAQSGNELRLLKADNEDLRRRLNAEATKLREIKMQNDEFKHMSRVKELEQILETREILLRKKEEELRNIRNNRPTTRATSTQPRSPKWGNGSRPTSPGVNNGVGNRGSGLRFSSEMSF